MSYRRACSIAGICPDTDALAKAEIANRSAGVKIVIYAIHRPSEVKRPV